MIEIKKLKDCSKEFLDALFNRFGEDFMSIMLDTVVPIVNEVKKGGDRAVMKFTEKFDGIKLKSLLVSNDEIEEGMSRVPGDILQAFLKAKENIEQFHQNQKRENYLYTRVDGTMLGVQSHAIENAAIYVPGGKASYPSSLLMGVIPAKIAGTKDISIITPPGKDGTVSPMVLALAKILGVSRIVKSGGVQGIAAAGFGTESVKKAHIIVGPGNIYVTAAKTYLFSMGIVQIDSMAGPSEVLIISDDKSNPKWVAYDMLSQAEHDPMSVALLVTTSSDFAARVKEEIVKDIEGGSGRHDIKKEAITKHGLIIIVENIYEAIEFSNRFGPEHMEFMVDKPLLYLNNIKNVGSLFLGRHSPVSVGDYYSGTNHILPTGGATRFSSGTSVDTFLRRTTIQMLTEEALTNARGPVKAMSKYEGFDDMHGGSVDIRFEGLEDD